MQGEHDVEMCSIQSQADGEKKEGREIVTTAADKAKILADTIINYLEILVKHKGSDIAEKSINLASSKAMEKLQQHRDGSFLFMLQPTSAGHLDKLTQKAIALSKAYEKEGVTIEEEEGRNQFNAFATFIQEVKSICKGYIKSNNPGILNVKEKETATKLHGLVAMNDREIYYNFNDTKEEDLWEKIIKQPKSSNHKPRPMRYL